MVTNNDSTPQPDAVPSVTTDTHASPVKGEGGGGPRHSNMVPQLVTVPQPVIKYMVLAKDDAEFKKTEDFLKTQSSTELYDMGYVTGWGNVTLTDDTKKKVEGHDGIAALAPEGEIVDFQALPVNEAS
jgi:hypothetical protein